MQHKRHAIFVSKPALEANFNSSSSNHFLYVLEYSAHAILCFIMSTTLPACVGQVTANDWGDGVGFTDSSGSCNPYISPYFVDCVVEQLCPLQDISSCMLQVETIIQSDACQNKPAMDLACSSTLKTYTTSQCETALQFCCK